MERLHAYLHATRHDDESLYQRCERFGRELGVSCSCVRKWLYRKRGIKDHQKLAIVRLTNGAVSVEDLIRGA